MGEYRKLKVWQRSKDFAVFIYRCTESGAFARDFGLRDQIRRAATSVPSNIAEGDELDTNKQAMKYFHVAKGSCAEVFTQSAIALEIGYIDQKTFEHIDEECQAISGMLSRLIQARAKRLKS